MPSTSICLPLLGKYLIFILILVISSIVTTCFIVNVHFRSPSTHIMSPWLRRLFLQTLPPYLLINLPEFKTVQSTTDDDARSTHRTLFNAYRNAQHLMNNPNNHHTKFRDHDESDHTTKRFTSGLQHRIQSPTGDGYIYPPELNRAIRNCLFIAYHLDNEDAYEHVSGLYAQFSVYVIKNLYTHVCVLYMH